MGKIKTLLKLIREDRGALRKAFFSNWRKTPFSRLYSDKLYIKKQFRVFVGKKLDLNNPQTFNEKLQWLKLYDRRPEYSMMVDKYAVKEYISKEIGEEYVIPTFGVWDRFEKIEFDKLPDQFVLKCTHDSGSIVICRDKKTFDYIAAKNKLKKSLKRNMFWHGREWPYKCLKPRIIAEAYMKQEDCDDLTDYKFYCFNGEPKFLYVSSGLSNHSTAHLQYVTLDWEKLPARRMDFPEMDVLPEKPKTFDKMIDFAKQLSKGIPFLRVDFYEIKGRLYFSELTFFPGAGLTKFNPDEWEYKIGSWIELPKDKKKV